MALSCRWRSRPQHHERTFPGSHSWRFELDDRRTSRRPCFRYRDRVADRTFAVSVGRVEPTRLYRGANRCPNDRTCHPQKKVIVSVVSKVRLGRTETVGAAMQQIADWLNALGLGQYAQRFAENDIDPSVLRDLTDHDLEKIGVSLGHRRKILRAIAELDEAGPGPAPSPRTEPERRHLTVIFADLVASPALSPTLAHEHLPV